MLLPFGQMDSVSKIDDLLKQLETLAEADAGPFHEGCRKAQAAVTKSHPHLVPDLDMDSASAGYRTWGRRILEWPDAQDRDGGTPTPPVRFLNGFSWAR